MLSCIDSPAINSLNGQELADLGKEQSHVSAGWEILKCLLKGMFKRYKTYRRIFWVSIKLMAYMETVPVTD